MAALDKVLDHLLAQKAAALTLRAGAPMELATGTGTRPIAQRTFSAAEVAAYLREIAGPAERAAIEAREPVAFSYREFTCQVQFGPGHTGIVFDQDRNTTV